MQAEPHLGKSDRHTHLHEDSLKRVAQWTNTLQAGTALPYTHTPECLPTR